ncbi:hypothetical protein AB4144_53550, partial [Rhizobiaceae sp. 2RAB30]
MTEPVATPAPASWQPRRRNNVLFNVAVALAVTVMALASWDVWLRLAPSRPEIPRLLIEWVDNLSERREADALARGLTQEIISQLSKFGDIVVVQSQDPATLPQVRYRLAGSVDLSGDKFRVRVRLLNRE